MDTKRRTVRSLVKRLSSPSEQTQTLAICELRLLSKQDEEARTLITEFEEVIPILTETLYSSSTLLQENAVATLLNISIFSRDILMSTRGLVDALSHLLRLGDARDEVVSLAAECLYSLLTVEHYRPIIGAKRDVVYGLVGVITGERSSPRMVKDGLKALFGISLYPLNRPTMVDLGVVRGLFSLVVNDGRVGIVEDASAVIAQVAGCYESGEAFRSVGGIGVLVDLLDSESGASERTKENAVAALLNLVQSGGEKLVAEVQEIGGMVVVDGSLDVAENGSVKAKSKAEALLNIIDAGGLSWTCAR